MRTRLKAASVQTDPGSPKKEPETTSSGSPKVLPKQEPGCTKFFSSGEIQSENVLRDDPKLFFNCGVMMTFFTIRKSKKARAPRRLRALLKDVPYVETKRVKKTGHAE